MKTRQLSIIATILACATLSLFFMNATFSPRAKAPGEKVDRHTRVSHARELLGSSYKKGAAHLYDKNPVYTKDILQTVRANLPGTHKKYSYGVTRAILRESKKHGLDPVFVLALIQTESKWNPTAIGDAGEIGLMQIRPQTAQWTARHFKMTWNGASSLKNPLVNVTLGIAYISMLRHQMGENSMKYLPAYNMGATAVRRLLAQNIQPMEYRQRVLANYELIYRDIASAGP